jgi:hypothetical protein
MNKAVPQDAVWREDSIHVCSGVCLGDSSARRRLSHSEFALKAGSQADYWEG